MSYLIRKEGLNIERTAFNASIDKNIIKKARLVLNSINNSLGSNVHLSILVENLLRDFLDEYKEDYKKIIADERDAALKL